MTYETLLKDTTLISVEGKTANVVVPYQFTGEMIENRIYQGLKRTFSDVIGQEVDFRFVPAAAPPLTAA